MNAKSKDFQFNEGNTYKMFFESSFLENTLISLAALRTSDLDSPTEASIYVVENGIVATLPNGLRKGSYFYDLEINRDGIITTEYKGSIRIL